MWQTNANQKLHPRVTLVGQHIDVNEEREQDYSMHLIILGPGNKRRRAGTSAILQKILLIKPMKTPNSQFVQRIYIIDVSSVTASESRRATKELIRQMVVDGSLYCIPSEGTNKKLSVVIQDITSL
ncbi:hypothetical protein T265_04725 [Opisthorchis viverrini]|uniref:Uncharacterized protein n=1 Tax=Opisthorchis viverrini TaxID=6198 RepID=A0A074ZRF4_OPIVI|nr:hypothetical protein T265_04725 [Opisthorchis viverrini]KER28412.1 hypothetical protein T265_04725 [Opisthorchis viverrini]